MDIMEDLMDDFGEMVDEQFPQQQKTRERIKSTNDSDLVTEGYEGKTKTMHKSKYQQNRRQTEGNLSFGDVRIGDPNSKSKIERSKSLKATSVSNLSRKPPRDRITSTSTYDLTGSVSNYDNIHRSKSLKESSSKASGSSGVGRSKSLKGTVSSYLMSKRKTDGNMSFGDLVSTAMKSRYKTVEEAGTIKKY